MSDPTTTTRPTTTRAKGTAFASRGKFFAVASLGGGKRIAKLAPHAVDLEQARSRAALATALCAQLTAAGHSDLHEKIVELVVDATTDERLEAVAAKVAGLCGGELVRTPAALTAPPTYRKVREMLTDGTLHKRFPDVVDAVSEDHAADVAAKAIRYVEPIVGDLEITEVTLDHALEVMRRLPVGLSAASRRHVAWGMRRVLGLAVFPLRLIKSNPIPDGFMPKLGRPRARGFLYPDEADRLVACDAVPLARRVLWAFLAREGMRKDEACGLEWSDTRQAGAVGWVDLDRGTVHLDEHKTVDTAGARDWPLDPGVAGALARWRKLQGEGARFVFGDGATPVVTDHLADVLREDLLAAGIDRPELHETTDTRRQMNVHDLRGVFVTTCMASGRTEAWIQRRTGHTTSAMLARYRRAAENLAEGGAAQLAPMLAAVPELGAVADGSADSSGVSSAGGCHADAAASCSDPLQFSGDCVVELTRIERAASRVRF